MQKGKEEGEEEKKESNTGGKIKKNGITNIIGLKNLQKLEC